MVISTLYMRGQTMFTYLTTIHLRATDATGVLYFAEQFRLALEAMEEYLTQAGLSLNTLLKGNFLMPIVHAEADYFSPLEVGDGIAISLEVGKIGTSSFTLQYKFVLRGENKEVGTVSITHVTVDKETRKKVPLPEPLVKILERVRRHEHKK
jgi:1,4-dihydroxy-2-naphthoyl-CoA hydrolase